MNISDELRQNIKKVLASEIHLEDADKRSEELEKERETTERLDKEYTSGKKSDRIYK